MNNYNNYYYNTKVFSICKSAIFLAILIIVKWRFNTVAIWDGVEIATGFWIILCLFCSKRELAMILFGFLFFSFFRYGLYTFAGYCIMFGSIGFLTVFLRRFLHRYYFLLPIYAFVMAFLVWLYFFPVDYLFTFSWVYATSMIVPAMPINLIEGATNFAFVGVFYLVFVKAVQRKKNLVGKPIFLMCKNNFKQELNY